MTVDPEALTSEFVRLRKGRGARAKDLVDQLGPQCRSLLGVKENDSAASVRTRLSELIAHHLGSDPELEIAALAALGLHAEANHRFLEGRTEWLAERLVCDGRTARRRISSALEALVERSAGSPLFIRVPTVHQPSRDDGGWFVRELRTVLRLDLDRVEAFEHRLIEFTEEEVSEIVYRFSLPRAQNTLSGRDHDLVLDPLYGVRLRDVERPIPEHFRFHLALPHSFRSNDRHQYGIFLRIPEDQPMRPYYVYTPYRRCDSFDLTVRFNPADPPATVWQLEEAVISVIESESPAGTLLVPDAFGEVHVRFSTLKTGLGYGLRWSTRPAD